LLHLYNTRTIGITYKKSLAGQEPKFFEGAKHPLDNGSNMLQTFADSDYAMDISRRSTMGYVLMMCGGPIAWSSVLGKTIATSTCEAEVNAAVHAAKEALHVKLMLTELGFIKPNVPLVIAEDNAACIAQAEFGIRHVRNAKHYSVKLHFLQQLVVDNDVEFVYCPTNEQLADFFTKPLDEDKFVTLRKMILFE
jgi:hypothetical protein